MIFTKHLFLGVCFVENEEAQAFLRSSSLFCLFLSRAFAHGRKSRPTSEREHKNVIYLLLPRDIDRELRRVGFFVVVVVESIIEK
jgi:hypothetical protein